MRKIAIIGASGSGKSTFAAKLQRKLGIPLYHLDSLYWRPDWVSTPKDEWVRLQERIVREPEWIVDGNYGGTLEIRMNSADTIIFLDFSPARCLGGAVKRFILRNRVDHIPGCREQLDLEFLKWIWNYRRKSAPKVRELLRGLRDNKRVYVFRTRRQLDRFYRELPWRDRDLDVERTP